MKRFIPVAVVLLLIAVFAAVLLLPKDRSDMAVGKIVDRELLQLPKGQTAIINVFASWCVPCVAELPALAELKKSTKLEVIGIAYKDKQEDAAAFLKKNGNPYDRVRMDDGSAALALGLTGVPETYVIDAQGKIVWHYPGALSQTQIDEIEQLVIP